MVDSRVLDVCTIDRVGLFVSSSNNKYGTVCEKNPDPLSFMSPMDQAKVWEAKRIAES